MSAPAPEAAAAWWREVDATRPWWRPYRDFWASAVARLESGEPAWQVLNVLAYAVGPGHGGGAMPRFVDARELPPGTGYEAWIAAKGAIPTRHGLHDFFNGLMWLRFPRLKRWLHEQHLHSPAQAAGPGRGRLRDSLTLFDENALLWAAPPPLAEALRQRRWSDLFVHQRAQWAAAEPVVFGHALLEKLVRPYKAITAHAWLLPPGADAAHWLPASPLHRAWCPLPVLGVPGWWAGNDDVAFYEDARVFRPLALQGE